ncbi:cell cycle control protein [Fusarium sporotrichioides]|uniref:Cell cycle control protein n=1 Tax=Fusarium sporotrichioides TaxID=5514 RepID=A0A395RNX4_FUSSP|nr:cell cycle control protein [Fusarium sporotrichioides]
MAENSDDFLEMLDEHQLMELGIGLGSRVPQNDPEPSLFLPSPSAPPATFAPRLRPRTITRPSPGNTIDQSNLGRPVRSRRSRAPQPHPDPHLRNILAPEPAQQAPVIDLTEEPDSPELLRARALPAQAAPNARNPRRTNSQRVSPPQLARTDGTFVGRSANVIDLTVDSPEEERPPRHFPHAGRMIPRPDDLIEVEIISQRSVPSFALGPFRRLAGIIGADIAVFNPPNLDISRNAYARPPSPKPRMPTPPPAREGFTRNTCTDPEKESESVVICPACNEELAYDPTGTVTQSSVGTAKGKRKRAPGEHHFWALKKCGHVYCADCFENRKPTKTNRDGVGFRSPDARPPNLVGNELRCAVDDCDTKVSAKTEWVGIFL